MLRVAWQFKDLITNTTISLGVNPGESDATPNQRQMTYEATGAPDGRTLAFEGNPQPQIINFSGTIITEAQYQQYAALMNFRNPVEFTDDLGRVLEVVVTAFQPKRKRNITFPWLHTFSGAMLVLREITPFP